jgi:CRP-like cAMP-binding protein
MTTALLSASKVSSAAAFKRISAGVLSGFPSRRSCQTCHDVTTSTAFHHWQRRGISHARVTRNNKTVSNGIQNVPKRFVGNNKDTSKMTSTRNARRRTSTMGQAMQESLPQEPLLHSINLVLNQPRALPIPRWISPQRVTFAYSELFGHWSFVLVAVSYAVDDFVQLRLIAIAGSSMMLIFTYFHPHGKVLWLPFRWNLLFIGLNSWRVARVYLDRYWSDQLLQEKWCRRMYDHHFYVMEKPDFARLVRLGNVESFRKGDVVIRQDDDNRYVRLVLKGDLSVDRDGHLTYLLHEGQFISESGLHAGLGLRGSVESCCTVSAVTDDVELLCWDRTELMRLLEMHKSIERALKAVMSWDIVSKLKSQRQLLASGQIKDVEQWTQKRREQTLSRYKAILHNMLDHPDYLNKHKEQLAKYREIHHIQMSEHLLALEEMGWTKAEFEAGIKEGQLNKDKLEKREMGLYWWLKGW